MRPLITIALALAITLGPACGGDDTSEGGPHSDDLAAGPNDDAADGPAMDSEGQGADTASGDASSGPTDAAPSPAEGCRSHEECTVNDQSEFGMYCATPFDHPVCGIPPREDCFSHEGCPGEMLCHDIPDGCSPNGIGSMCNDSCLDFPEMCGDGEGDEFVCGEDGACVAQSCLDGHACHTVQVCDPTAEGGDPHGCHFISCQGDMDCEAGDFCVLGRCLDALGTCAEMMLVP